MKYRKFHDEDISLLGFGFMRPPYKSGRVDTEQLQFMVDTAVSNGVNYFDTAYIYWGGKSETVLGQMLKKHDRSKINIATKLMLSSPKSKAELEVFFQTQLKRLETDYIDFYLFHMVTEARFRAYVESNLYEFLEEKKKQGLVRNIGFSYHDRPEFLPIVAGMFDWDFAQIQLNYMDWTFQKANKQYDILRKLQLPIWVMEPVRGGELARLPKEAGVLLQELNGGSEASYALRWAMSFPEVVCVLSGMSSIEQVTENIETAKKFKAVTIKEKKVLEKVLAIHLSSGAIPCSGCGYCAGECPKNVDIPTTFSLYNDYLRHGTSFLRFYGHISSGRRADKCISCGLCKQFCPQHIDIPSKLSEICTAVEIMREKTTKKSNGKVGNTTQIIIKNELFKFQKTEDNIISLFRQNRHCIGKPAKGEDRWVRFPLGKALEKGKEYILDFEIKTTYAMKNSFFVLGNGGKTEYLPVGLLPPNEWCERKLKFTAGIDGIYAICITATDLPVAGNYFYLRKMKLNTTSLI